MGLEFGLFELLLDQVNECGHGGGDPLVFVPEDVGGYVERWAGPVQRFELTLAELACDDYSR